MDHTIVDRNYEHKLISALNCGGRNSSKVAIPEIFFDN